MCWPSTCGPSPAWKRSGVSWQTTTRSAHSGLLPVLLLNPYNAANSIPPTLRAATLCAGRAAPPPAHPSCSGPQHHPGRPTAQPCDRRSSSAGSSARHQSRGLASHTVLWGVATHEQVRRGLTLGLSERFHRFKSGFGCTQKHAGPHVAKGCVLPE